MKTPNHTEKKKKGMKTPNHIDNIDLFKLFIVLVFCAPNHTHFHIA